MTNHPRCECHECTQARAMTLRLEQRSQWTPETAAFWRDKIYPTPGSAGDVPIHVDIWRA